MSENLGELGDLIYAKSAEIATIDAQRKELDSERTALENRLIAAMQAAGTDTARGKVAAVSISISPKPKIDDIEALYSFVLRKKALHLFERRIAATAYREMKDQLGKPIPGLSEFNVTRLNVRKA